MVHFKEGLLFPLGSLLKKADFELAVGELSNLGWF